ncbi:hypothetical protein [Pontibacter ramchanderi]|uniref:Uncharacterized protein n=1 Tax=Pontibacter ramchanderi TaxID=1179743 RepID=A0A2N3U7I8_9BACT|nr:hypothetical protein [Pontibacter ramchanderi]PKV62718.1 hypothetical protein BD749_3603 [Pontibacter ramchanderi]
MIKNKMTLNLRQLLYQPLRFVYLPLRVSAFALLVSLLLSACTATREQEIEGDVNEFRSWVNAQTNKLEERTEEDWKRTKEDFKQRTAELDRKQESFSEKLRADYQQIKADFKAREAARDSMANNEELLTKWERDLLGQYANGTALSAANVEQAYQNFMSNVRARKKNWREQDWEMAAAVLEELNQRKAAFEELPDETEVRIKTLQMEFAALKESETAN